MPCPLCLPIGGKQTARVIITYYLLPIIYYLFCYFVTLNNPLLLTVSCAP